MARAPRTNDPSLSIPRPPADLQPLKANLFNAMQKGNTTLLPLFPYMHPGAIVPTGALFTGEPGKDYAQFYHHNSVDEIIIAFVASGATLETGQVYNGGRVHGVNSFLKDQTKPSSYCLFTVTQRQLDEGAQPEAMTMLCEKCRKEIFRCEWDGASTPGARELDHPMSSIYAPAAFIEEYKAGSAKRTCADCGHENRPFPLRTWGWDLYSAQSRTMQSARDALQAAAEKARS